MIAAILPSAASLAVNGAIPPGGQPDSFAALFAAIGVAAANPDTKPDSEGRADALPDDATSVAAVIDADGCAALGIIAGAPVPVGNPTDPSDAIEPDQGSDAVPQRAAAVLAASGQGLRPSPAVDDITDSSIRAHPHSRAAVAAVPARERLGIDVAPVTSDPVAPGMAMTVPAPTEPVPFVTSPAMTSIATAARIMGSAHHDWIAAVADAVARVSLAACRCPTVRSPAPMRRRERPARSSA